MKKKNLKSTKKVLFKEIFYKGKMLRIAVNVRDSGEDLIVFIHGLGCTKDIYSRAFQMYTLSKYSLLAFDLIGYGNSENPSDFSYALEDQAGMAQELLKQFRFSKVHIVAHSLGGVIGVLLAEKIGEQMGTFVSIEGTLSNRESSLIRKRVMEVTYKEFKNIVFRELKNKFSVASDKGSQSWARWSEKADPQVFYKTVKLSEQLLQGDTILCKFQTLPCKKVYIYGEENYRRKAYILDRLRNVLIISIPRSNHFVMNDNPQDFYEQLSRVISQT